MTRLVASLLMLVAFGMAGCQHNPFTAGGLPADSGGLAGYAERLASLDPAERGQALAQARDAWERRETPTTRARLGLARGQWGHDGHDPTAAREDLNAALSDPDASWPAAERAFLHLRIRQLKRHTAERRDQNQLVSENRRLQRKLEDAERKLRAISEIEEDLGNTGNSQ